MTREELLSITIEKTSDEKYQEIKNTLGELEKPVDGLGRFEEIICKIGAIGQTSKPDISNKTLVVMCADNGILEEGVSDVGGYVTGVTAKNMSEGKSLVNLLAENSGINILPIDIGINGDIEGGSLLVNKIAKGTKNFLKEPAMSEEEALSAISFGIDIVKKLKDEGTGIILTGDMGVGNSTTAVALICAILEGDPNVLTGRSVGLSDSLYQNKLNVIFEGLHKYGYDLDNILVFGGYDIDRREDKQKERVFEMVTNLGGLDIAGLIGIYIGGAMYHVPVVVDGIISAAAALAAENMINGCKDYMIGSHFGKEPATEIVFNELELEPVINAEMTAGEGVGAVMLMPLIDMVMNMYYKLKPSEELDFDGV